MGQNFVTMKKISLIISFVVLFAIGGNAQSSDFRIGLKLGPSFDWASPGSEQTTNNGTRLGFKTGLVFDYYFADHFAVSSGVNVNFLRMKYTFTDRRWVEDFLEETNVQVSRQLNATNFEIPVKLKTKFDVADAFAIYAEAGAGLSYNSKDLCLDNCKFDFYWAPGEKETDETYIDYTNQYRPLQLSMIVGLGVEYEINADWSAFAQLTFDHSFSNAFVSALQKKTGSILRNNFIGIEIGIMY